MTKNPRVDVVVAAVGRCPIVPKGCIDIGIEVSRKGIIEGLFWRLQIGTFTPVETSVDMSASFTLQFAQLSFRLPTSSESQGKLHQTFGGAI